MKTTNIVFLIAGVALVLAGVCYLAFAEPRPALSTSNVPHEQKINIDAVCQGALAYMTFSSGAEADAFVQDCKDGKHPEVIEQWKLQQGITDDRAI